MTKLFKGWGQNFKKKIEALQLDKNLLDDQRYLTAANPFQFEGQFQLINCCTIFLNQQVKMLSITFFSQTANFIQHQVLDGLKLTNITNQLNSSLSPLIAVAFSTSLIEAIYCLYFASSLGFYQGRASAVAVSCYRNNTFEFRSNRYLLFPI